MNWVLQLNNSQSVNSFNSLLGKFNVLNSPNQPNQNPNKSVIDRGNLRIQNMCLLLKVKRSFSMRSMKNVCTKNLVLQIDRGHFGSSHFGASHFSQTGCDAVSRPAQEVAFLILLHLCQSGHPMVRKGWTHVEVPNGWVQIIRGPRPKSVQWPRAHDRKPQQPQRHVGGQRQATEVPKKDSRQVGVGQALYIQTERIARARVRVGQLESALKALDPLDLAAASLQEALKRAQFQARVPPIESRVKSRRGVFGQETEAVVGGGGCCGCSRRRSRSFKGRSCRGREKFGEDSGGEIEIARASRFSSDGCFAIKAVHFDGRVGKIADAGCPIAGSERRIDVVSQTSSRRVRSSTRP